MNDDLIRAVSESLIRLRFLAATYLIKPMREMERERGESTPGCMHVLGLLKSKKGPVSMTDLAEASYISKPNLTTMVDRLCADGLAERSANPNDRRIVNVSLTQKGMELMERRREDFGAFIESRLSVLEEPDLEKLQLALNDLIGILEKFGENRKDADICIHGRGRCSGHERTGPYAAEKEKANQEKG
jgi:DNA-binding MarR family transcriptional regulator